MPIGFIGGTDEEIRAGKGELLLTTTQAAYRLNTNENRVREFVNQNVLTPYEERVFNIPLFRASEIEKLRTQRLKRGY